MWGETILSKRSGCTASPVNVRKLGGRVGFGTTSGRRNINRNGKLKECRDIRQQVSSATALEMGVGAVQTKVRNREKRRSQWIQLSKHINWHLRTLEKD